jgi:Uma2 family endonuclease
LVWISRGRLAAARDSVGHLRAAPELAIEVLSPGTTNERRDRELKLKLYSRQGVQEYWIVDWRLRTVQVYRRSDQQLQLVGTLGDGDILTSPILPDFEVHVEDLWEPTD